MAQQNDSVGSSTSRETRTVGTGNPRPDPTSNDKVLPTADEKPTREGRAFEGKKRDAGDK